MKKHIIVVLVLGATVTLIPSALADSFGYKNSGSGVAGSLATDMKHAGTGGSIAGGTPGIFSQSSEISKNLGTGASGLRQFEDTRFASDNLLNQGNSINRLLEQGGVLVDLSSNDLNLLFGSHSNREGANSLNFGRVNSGDKSGGRASREISRRAGMLMASTATLAATPEPGSLFLLGTGLLGMALVLFRKAAKRPTNF